MVTVSMVHWLPKIPEISVSPRRFWSKKCSEEETFGNHFGDGALRKKHWVVVSNIFYFHPYLGKWSHLTNIFQMGWNHQLENMFFMVLILKDEGSVILGVQLQVSSIKEQRTKDLRYWGRGMMYFSVDVSVFSWWSDELVVHENWWTCFHSLICSMYDILKLNCRYAWSIFDAYLIDIYSIGLNSDSKKMGPDS